MKTNKNFLMIGLLLAVVALYALSGISQRQTVSAAPMATATATTVATATTIAATANTVATATTVAAVTADPAVTATPTPVAPVPAANVPAAASTPGRITVSGSAQVLVAPDEVVLVLGIETNDLSMAVAKKQNDEIMQRALGVATRYGIESKNIQTDFINIEPRYDGSQRSQNFIGYFVRKTVEIHLRDISKFESLYSDMLEAGVNYVHSIDFRTTELRKYRDQARANAIQAAQEKARDLAAGVNLHIGQVKTIQENSDQWYGSYSSWWYRSGGAMIQNSVQNMGGSPIMDEGTLAPGQISVNASVTVEFELVP